MIRVSIIGDVCNEQYHEDIASQLPGGHILIHTGNCTPTGHSTTDIRLFLDWFSSLPYEHKFLVPGDEDHLFNMAPDIIWEWADFSGISVLSNTVHILEDSKFRRPIKIYGSLNEENSNWNSIPGEVDILITHTPPYMVRDYNSLLNVNEGSSTLRHKVWMAAPRMHIFSKVYSSYGTDYNRYTKFINASLVDCKSIKPKRKSYKDLKVDHPPIHLDWNLDTSVIRCVDINIPGESLCY